MDKLVKHTPGPWKKESHRNIVNLNSKGIVDIAVVLGSFNSQEADANWRLMLEAPEMHAIVERVACMGRTEPELARKAELLLRRVLGVKVTDLPGMGYTDQGRTCDETKGNYSDNPLLALYDEVIQECNIREVIGRYLAIEKVGNTQMSRCVCPFHMDHKPSMEINEESQKFKCLSCGESGDVVDFMMKYWKSNEKAALLSLAGRAGIDPDDFLKKSEQI